MFNKINILHRSKNEQILYDSFYFSSSLTVINSCLPIYDPLLRYLFDCTFCKFCKFFLIIKKLIN